MAHDGGTLLTVRGERGKENPPGWLQEEHGS